MIINIMQHKYKSSDDEDEDSDNSKGYNSDTNSTFDYAQLYLDDGKRGKLQFTTLD